MTTSPSRRRAGGAADATAAWRTCRFGARAGLWTDGLGKRRGPYRTGGEGMRLEGGAGDAGDRGRGGVVWWGCEWKALSHGELGQSSWRGGSNAGCLGGEGGGRR